MKRLLHIPASLFAAIAILFGVLHAIFIWLFEICHEAATRP